MRPATLTSSFAPPAASSAPVARICGARICRGRICGARSAVPESAAPGSAPPVCHARSVDLPRRRLHPIRPACCKCPARCPPTAPEPSGTRRDAARILGTAGPLRRFRVAVENGSGEDVDDVRRLRCRPRSATSAAGSAAARCGCNWWPPAGRTTSRCIWPPGTPPGRCAAAGARHRDPGRPYTSCRTPGKAIINLDRWRLSAVPYLAAKVPLATYRQYVINHEVGHELGHHHAGLSAAGRPVTGDGAADAHAAWLRPVRLAAPRVRLPERTVSLIETPYLYGYVVAVSPLSWPRTAPQLLGSRNRHPPVAW